MVVLVCGHVNTVPSVQQCEACTPHERQAAHRLVWYYLGSTDIMKPNVKSLHDQFHFIYK